MVSKASELLPEPETPVMTTSLSRGMVRSTFLRLCSRAPLIMMASSGKGILQQQLPNGSLWCEFNFSMGGGGKQIGCACISDVCAGKYSEVPLWYFSASGLEE